MKKIFLLFLAITLPVGFASEVNGQTTIHNWNFNVNTPASGAQWPSPIPATTGAGSLTNIFTDVQSFTGSTVNSEVGDVAGGSFCPINQTNNLNSFDLTVPTTGFVSINFSYATRRTSTGFTTQSIYYSLDGTTFILDTVMTNILATGFETIPRVADFSDISSANNNPNFKIRIVVDGATSASGNNRFDNVKISGSSSSLNDGAGTASLSNETASTLNGSTIFSRNSGSQTVKITVTGVSAGSLDQVRLTVPSDFTGFSGSNVTLGGAFVGKSTSIVGNQITVLSAALGTTPGTITISNLTSPNPVGALLDGNSNWIVETAKSDGVLTAIASSPKSYTIIPISNIRTGGADGYGNNANDTSAMNGQTVAIEGVATIENGKLTSVTSTSFFIQNSGYGIQIFRSGTPTTSWLRGDGIIVKGVIETFDGSTEVVPATTASPDFFNTGVSTLPTPLVLTNASDITEQHEGKLIKLNSATFDSVGQTFIASATNRGRNNFRTSVSDTGTLYLNAANTSVVGKTIPTGADIIGIVYHRKSIIGLGQTAYKIAVRSAGDLGMDEADGSGTATITPSSQLSGATSLTETLVLKGNTPSTIVQMSVTIPSTWTWTGNVAHAVLTGAGFSSATKAMTGDGSSGNPYVITVSNSAVTSTDSGIVTISNLTAPIAAGATTYIVKTRGATGTLSNIATSPTVNITGGAFEAFASGNWNSPSTWTGGVVPSAGSNVTFTTKNVVVTITADAQCNNLTMTGIDTTGGAVGPVLQFDASATVSLIVNGRLDLSGTIGRPQITSNGNTSATLIAKGYVFTNVSNTTANGNRGLNMNEGNVKILGTTTDSLRTGAGFRLANLVIGDGVNPKTLIWVQTSSATMNVRSLTIKSGSSLILGGTTQAQANSIGNASTTGVPMLTGGVTIENGASLTVNNSSAAGQVANVNIKNGGLTNNGTMNLKSADGSRLYNVAFGGLSADITTAKQIYSGSGTSTFKNVAIGGATGADTLIVNATITLDTLTINANGMLEETASTTVVGLAKVSRTLAQGVNNNFGGICIEINAAGEEPGSTVVERVTGVAQIGNGKNSILRYFNITPTVNTGLNAAFVFKYDNSELAGQTASTLQLFKSDDAGLSWAEKGGVVNTTARTITLAGVNDFSRWTAADANNNIGGAFTIAVSSGWNMLSIPLTVPDYRKIILFPTAQSSAFAYDAGYASKDTLKNGAGYWLKFNANQNIPMSGSARASDSIVVSTGWNMVGSVSSPVPKSKITMSPGVNITSQFYQYQAGYTQADTVFPGKAYWVKVSAPGKLYLNSGVGFKNEPK